MATSWSYLSRSENGKDLVKILEPFEISEKFNGSCKIWVCSEENEFIQGTLQFLEYAYEKDEPHTFAYAFTA